jgi:hypothetical protein
MKRGQKECCKHDLCMGLPALLQTGGKNFVNLKLLVQYIEQVTGWKIHGLFSGKDKDLFILQNISHDSEVHQLSYLICISGFLSWVKWHAFCNNGIFVT